MARSQSHVLTDHNEIRKWAEERDASPACVRGTGGKNDIGMLRLDFPGYSGEQSLEHIDWNEWFDKFDESGLALLVQDSTARGERSNFNKLVSRHEGREARAGKRKTAAGRKSNARSTRTSAASSRRKTTRKSTSAKKRSGRTTARKTASTRSRSTSVKAKSRSTGRKSASRSKARSSSRSRSSASTANQSGRNTRNTSASRSRSTQRGSSRGRAASNVLVDHDEIRSWAEQRNAEPACVRGTGGGNDPGMIRLDFPGYSGADSLERIDWEDWFRAFDENGLALVVQETTAGGEQSNFNKLVSRENAMAGSKRGSKQVRASAGNTGTKKASRGSNRAQRTESARGRTTSQRRAA